MPPKKEASKKIIHSTPDAVKNALTVKAFFDLEDEEALSLDAEQQATRFCDFADDILENFQKLEEFKKLFAADAECVGAGKDLTIGKTKAELLEKNMVNLMLMKRMNRLAHYRNKKRRDSVAEDRQKVDELYLQLQNLLYEVTHVEQEVERCTDFRSADEDIELIPVEKFYKEATPSISKLEVTLNDPHQQRLARLTWELESRKLLASEVERMRDEKNEIEAETEAKQALLDTLQPKLEALLEASKPVQELLGMNYQKEAIQSQKARYLPKPLFYAYVQTLAYKDMFDKTLAVSVEGEIDEVKKFDEIDKRAGQAEMSDDELSESGDSKSSKSKKVGSKKGTGRRLTLTDVVDQRLPDVLNTHPMRLDFRILCREKATLTLQLFYIPYLDVVTTKCRLELMADVPRAIASAGDLLSDECLLVNLMDNDRGLTCPNPVGQARLNYFSIDIADNVDTVGRPYIWVQRMCGLRFFGGSPLGTTVAAANFESDSGNEDCNFLQAVLQSIKRRILARLALQEQISFLELLDARHIPTEFETLFDGRDTSALKSWKSITPEEYQAKCSWSKVAEPSVKLENCWFFEMSICRKEGVLTSFIRVDNNYPKTQPVFSIILQCGQKSFTPLNTAFLKHLEKSVNIDCLQTISDISSCLSVDSLTLQIRWLMSRFDVAFEIFDGRVKPEHLYRRSVRGKNRQLPFNYSAVENCYDF